jgi:3-isopropylmalate dehydrogenase
LDVNRASSVRVAVIRGDGIGPEVTAEAEKVLLRLGETRGLPIALKQFDWGAEKYLREGVSLPDGALEMLRRDFDAILAGAFGDPRVPSNQHAADILLGIRFGLDLYANERPVRLLDARLCPLKAKSEGDINLVFFRENTEGAYSGIGGCFKKGTAEEVAVQEDVNTRRGVERIIVHAFEFASRTGRQKVCMCDKSNALPYGHGLWLRTFHEVQARYPGIEARHLYADTTALELVRDPGQFEVIVAPNMIGDILSDLGSSLVGGLGLSPSANLHPGNVSMFEPVHGSAPALAGKQVANPFASILAAAMMIEKLGFGQEAAAVEARVAEALHRGKTTSDLGGELKTREAGDWICAGL